MRISPKELVRRTKTVEVVVDMEEGTVAGFFQEQRCTPTRLAFATNGRRYWVSPMTEFDVFTDVCKFVYPPASHALIADAWEELERLQQEEENEERLEVN